MSDPTSLLIPLAFLTSLTSSAMTLGWTENIDTIANITTTSELNVANVRDPLYTIVWIVMATIAFTLAFVALYQLFRYRKLIKSWFYPSFWIIGYVMTLVTSLMTICFISSVATLQEWGAITIDGGNLRGSYGISMISISAVSMVFCLFGWITNRELLAQIV